jgi:hypothetical protein
VVRGAALAGGEREEREEQGSGHGGLRGTAGS